MSVSWPCKPQGSHQHQLLAAFPPATLFSIRTETIRAIRLVDGSKGNRTCGASDATACCAGRAGGESRSLRAEADEIVCLETPEDFFAVGQFYHDFHQVSDDEVKAILQKERPAEAHT